MARKRPKKLSDQLRAAIDASEMTRYRIALEAEIDHATLSRFMSGKGGLSVDGMDRLAETLGLELTERRAATRPTKKGR